MRRRHFLAAQAWYAISQGAPAFLNPYINLFFARDVGLRPSQIGLLSALRPWISAPCGSIVAGLADRWGGHRFVLLFTYVAVTLVQGLMALPPLAGFVPLLVITALASTVYTPSQIIADAAVMAASTHPGDYGRLRTWASVSWTAFAPLAGWINSRFGIRIGIGCYVVGSLLALPAAWMLPVEALRRKVAPIIERGLSKELPEQAGAPATPAGALPELQQPLLAEEAPPPTPVGERSGLSRALAIIRYIEAITELGVAPPAGVGLYGYAALPLQYASHHLAPHAEEDEEVAASPGYSPFAGAQEPGSESPPFGWPLSNGAAAVQQAAQAGAAGAGPSRLQARPPTAALAAGGGRWQAGEEPDGAVHGSHMALGSLDRARQPPRTATLPRPISADNLGRVASLAYGIPGVRTRAQAGEPAAASMPEAETDEEEITSPDSDVILAPHSAPHVRSAQAPPAEEDAAQGAMFAADDLPAARTASTMLRDVRGIRTAQQAQQAWQAQQAAGAAGPTGASAAEVGREVSEELPVSTSPPDAESMTVAGPDVLAPPVAGGPEPAAEEPAATPAYRSAALQRLAHIFGGVGGGGAAHGAGGQGRGAVGAGAAAEDEEQDEEAGSLPPEAALPLSPVQKYISYRAGKRLARKEAQRAAAAAEGREPPPPTPLPASLSSFGGLLGSITPRGLLASTLREQAAQQAAASTPRQLMREAVDQELQDAAQEHDPTGTLIVSMLSKKLERLAAEERRQQRVRRRAERKAAAATAAAAAAAAAEGAPPPAGLGAAGTEAGSWQGAAPQQEEGPATVKIGERQAEAPLGFGAALKRLLSNPEVAAFFALTAILGFGHGIIGSFLFMFLAEQGSSEMLMGYVLMANALPELPAFFFFGRILATLGMNTVLLSAAASLGIRIWAYALLPRIGLHWVVPIEALHAITYACGWSASAVNSSKIAPPGLESTTQAIFQGLWTGVGCGVAGLLGGVLYGTHGPALLFQASGIAILGSTALAAAVLVAVRWRRKRRPALLPSSESFDQLPH